MSRIGKQEILIPSGVAVTVDNKLVVVKGPKGELTYEHRPEINVNVVEDKVICKIGIATKNSKAFWGLTRSLIANMVQGVSEGYEKKLQLVGVGYRATPKGASSISLAVGYSNPVEYEAPEGVTIDVEDNTKVTIKGADKQLVGLAAAQIRKIRKPEPYKGKGIRYEDEVVRRKPGKAGKVQ